MITLTNSFHNTSVNLRPTISSANKYGPKELHLSARQVKRARRVLCGVDGCLCGDDIGARGEQRYCVDVYPDGDGVVSHDARDYDSTCY